VSVNSCHTPENQGERGREGGEEGGRERGRARRGRQRTGCDTKKNLWITHGKELTNQMAEKKPFIMKDTQAVLWTFP